MDDSKQHPMPDILLTVGESFKRYLMKNGKYSIPLETFAALRFSYPTNDGRYIVQPPNLKIIRKVLYAFPVHIDQYYQTIKDLIVVFGGSDILVDLKFHPLYCSSDIEDEFILPKNFNIVSFKKIHYSIYKRFFRACFKFYIATNISYYIIL